MRRKMDNNKKKKKLTITINEELSKIFSKYVEDNNISNISRVVEDLIRKDMSKKGEDVSRDF